MRANSISLDVFEGVARQWHAGLSEREPVLLTLADQRILCRMVLSLVRDLRTTLPDESQGT